jgi:hypothetical protein
MQKLVSRPPEKARTMLLEPAMGSGEWGMEEALDIF